MATQLAAVLEQGQGEVIGHGADATRDLGHGGIARRRQREGEAEGAAPE